MPLYNYHCRKCNDYREYHVHSYSNNPSVCERCGLQGELERLAIQPFALGKTSSDRETESKVMDAIGGTPAVIVQIEDAGPNTYKASINIGKILPDN